MSVWRFLAVLLAIAIAVGIGAAVYNAGVTAGLAEAAQQAASSGDPLPVPYGYGYGPYWHGPFGAGFGFFGFFFLILGIFLVIGLVRAAFGWRRWNGPRGPGGLEAGAATGVTASRNGTASCIGATPDRASRRPVVDRGRRTMAAEWPPS